MSRPTVTSLLFQRKVTGDYRFYTKRLYRLDGRSAAESGWLTRGNTRTSKGEVKERKVGRNIGEGEGPETTAKGTGHLRQTEETVAQTASGDTMETRRERVDRSP